MAEETQTQETQSAQVDQAGMVENFVSHRDPDRALSNILNDAPETGASTGSAPGELKNQPAQGKEPPAVAPAAQPAGQQAQAAPPAQGNQLSGILKDLTGPDGNLDVSKIESTFLTRRAAAQANQQPIFRPTTAQQKLQAPAAGAPPAPAQAPAPPDPYESIHQTRQAIETQMAQIAQIAATQGPEAAMAQIRHLTAQYSQEQEGKLLKDREAQREKEWTERMQKMDEERNHAEYKTRADSNFTMLAASVGGQQQANQLLFDRTNGAGGYVDMLFMETHPEIAAEIQKPQFDQARVNREYQGFINRFFADPAKIDLVARIGRAIQLESILPELLKQVKTSGAQAATHKAQGQLPQKRQGVANQRPKQAMDKHDQDAFEFLDGIGGKRAARTTI